mmetsp:Transcript_26574/g.61563  ORF Transcript_26574/g.61563 Transcript_26574/m.61563 type:complete len:280 (-) Transcript_26574:531-1370(-)
MRHHPQEGGLEASGYCLKVYGGLQRGREAAGGGRADEGGAPVCGGRRVRARVGPCDRPTCLQDGGVQAGKVELRGGDHVRRPVDELPCLRQRARHRASLRRDWAADEARPHQHHPHPHLQDPPHIPHFRPLHQRPLKQHPGVQRPRDRRTDGDAHVDRGGGAHWAVWAGALGPNLRGQEQVEEGRHRRGGVCGGGWGAEQCYTVRSDRQPSEHRRQPKRQRGRGRRQYQGGEGLNVAHSKGCRVPPAILCKRRPPPAERSTGQGGQACHAKGLEKVEKV